MLIRELVTQLGFDIDLNPLDQLDDKVVETTSNITSLGTVTDETFEQIKGALKTARNILLGFTASAAAGGVALFALAKSAANAGDEISKTAPMLGFTAEEYQKYRYAAELAGVENESFTASTQMLLRNVGELKGGNIEVAKSFKKVGISVAEVKHLSTADLYRKMAVGLEKIPDQATRIQVSMDLLGRSGARLGTFLAKGTKNLDSMMSDVEAFGMFSKDSAEAANDFNDSLSRVMFFFSGIKNEIGAGLMPVFRGMMDDFREWLSLHRETIKVNIAKFVELFTMVLTKAWTQVKRVVHAFEVMIKIMGGLRNAFRLLGIFVFALFIPLIASGTAAIFVLRRMLLPIIRLHTLLGLIAVSIALVTGLFHVFLFAASAVAASKIIGFLIQLAGGYQALAAKILLPTALFLAQAAALAFLVLAFEDLTMWFEGGSKTLIGEWIGEWEEVPNKLRKVWDEIKAVFKAGGEFIAAVFRGDFKEAYRLLAKAGDKVISKDGAGLAVTGTQAATQGLQSYANTYGYHGDDGSLPGAQFAGAPSTSPRRGATGRGGALSNGFIDSFTLGPGLNGAPGKAAGHTQVKNNIKVDVSLTLPPGTSAKHAEDTMKIVDERLRQQIEHSLNQTVPPGG